MAIPKTHELMVRDLKRALPSLTVSREVPRMKPGFGIGKLRTPARQAGTEKKELKIPLGLRPVTWELTPSHELGTVFIRPVTVEGIAVNDVPANDPSGHGGQRYMRKYDLSLGELRSALFAKGLVVEKPRERVGPSTGKVSEEKTEPHYVTTLRLQTTEEVPHNEDITQHGGMLHLSLAKKQEIREKLDELEKGTGLRLRLEDVEEHGAKHTVIHIL
ncbi:MAG: hypothetical protein V1834_03485 [Candidatus Micrarchaeota archaeon]